MNFSRQRAGGVDPPLWHATPPPYGRQLKTFFTHRDRGPIASRVAPLNPSEKTDHLKKERPDISISGRFTVKKLKF